MNQAFPMLFKHGKIGELELKNRIVKAPQFTHLGARDGSVTERLIRYYKEVAKGGSALVIVEFAYMDNKASKSGACQLGAADNEYIPGLSLLAQTIQANGAKAALQIAHCGRQKLLATPPIKAASRVPSEDFQLRGGAVPEELAFEEVREIVGSFGDAARRAKVAGFDMVEIHGAHGYLITNFLSPRTNKRTDWYGGSPENRARFLLDIVTDVRKKVGLDFPLSIRLSGTEYEPDGIMIEDTIEVTKSLEKLGVDVIHVSGGNYHQRVQRISTMGIPLGPMVWAAEAIKKAVQIPVIASGSINTPELAEDILENGKADFVALGRPLFADPYWPRKAEEGRPEDIRPCIRCNDGCFERSTIEFKAITCTVNIALGKEDEFAIIPTLHHKKVAVIGGGPAGMEAARVCALRGHDVTLYEKRKLGGVLIEASIPEFKADLKRLINYFAIQVDKNKVEVVRKEATLGTIKEGKFDAVIVAVGGNPIKPDVPGINKQIVTGALEVLNGKAQLGKKVIIVGGGTVGTEVGLFLAEQGKEIIIVEMLDEFMNGVGVLDKTVYEERLFKQNVTIHTGSRLENVHDKGAVVVDRYGKREDILADSIVLTAGFAPQRNLAGQLQRETSVEVYTVGDCVNTRKILDAIHEGHLAARNL